jgi:hypothetical protein
MAVNDSRHISKLLIAANENAPMPDSLEISIASGETLHLFRLLCAHLYEAGVAFRSLSSELFEKAVAGNSRGEKDLDYLRDCYSEEPKQAFHYSYLKPIRDNLGFHYKNKPLEEALRYHNAKGDLEGVLVIAEFLGLGRYTIGDHLANAEIKDILGVDLNDYPERLTEKMREVVQLSGALSYVVDQLIFSVVKSRRDAILQIEEGTITVPPFLAKAKQKTDNK